MAYRFTNTDKWGDSWFYNLPGMGKLLFIYLCDNCDIAGFIEVNLRKWAFDLMITEKELQGALKGLERGILFSKDNDVLYLKNFLKHQKNIPINMNNKVHQGIIRRFEENAQKFDIKDIETFINNPMSSPYKAPTEGLERGTGNSNSNSSSNDLEVNSDLVFKKEEIKEEENFEFYPFEEFWNDYDKKVGLIDKLKLKWAKISEKDRLLIKNYIPLYKQAQPDKTFRKDPATFLNNKSWNDEIIIKNTPQVQPKKGVTLDQMQEIYKNLTGRNGYNSNQIDVIEQGEYEDLGNKR